MKIKAFISTLFYFFIVTLSAQTHPDFTILHNVKTSSVKNQENTGTCWAYATASFLESEAIRKGKPVYNLSEMFVVRHVYKQKADKYVRMHGKANFSQGGQAHDYINAVAQYGIVPENVYSGLAGGQTFHNHEQLERILKVLLDDISGKPEVGTTWKLLFEGILDAQLGKIPTTFEYEGKPYTPETFAKQALGFEASDYVELTSYTHHPFYTQFDLEVPDNWSHDRYYNIPVEELLKVMNYALENGYSIDWDGDVSETGFDHKTGSAELSIIDKKMLRDMDMQAYRQYTFDQLTTTDDHLMHITALAQNKSGELYFLTKNSWGSNTNSSDGFLYMSSDYVKLKTVAILVHKDAIPKDIAKKIGLL